MQISGITTSVQKKMDGLQLAGILNYSRDLDGSAQVLQM